MIVPSLIQYYLVLSCSILSILGSLFIISISLAFSEVRVFYTKIVVYIAISDLIRSIGFLIPCNDIDNLFLTNLIAIINDSCFVITLSWSAHISITLYRAILDSEADFEKYFKQWFVMSFIIIPGLNILPSFTNSHGRYDSVCTFSGDWKGIIWRYTIMYFPAWVFIGISAFSCIRIYMVIRSVDIDEGKMQLVKKLLFYPIILIIEVVPLTITTLMTGVFNESSRGLIQVIAFCLYSIHGFSNAVIFALTMGIKNLLNKYYHASKLNQQERIYENCDTNDFDSSNLLYTTFSELDSENSINK